MQFKKILFLTLFLFAIEKLSFSQKTNNSAYSGNPIFPGWYADPEAHIYDHTYWVYPTFSDTYENQIEPSDSLSSVQKEAQKNTINKQYLKQTFLDAFSSKDLVHWEKHSHILDIKNVSWAAYAVWAPSITEKGGKYYLFFGANDIQNNKQPGGMGIAVSESRWTIC